MAEALQFYFLAEFGDFDVAPAGFEEGVAEVELGLLFAVDQEEGLHFAFVLAVDVLHHFFVVAVTGERFDAAQFGSDLMGMAKDGHFLVATHDFGPKGFGFAVADTEYGGGGVFDVVGEMVFDSASLHHARGGDDDTGFVAQVEFLGGLDGLDVLQAVESEGVGVFLHVVEDGLAEAFGVEAHDVGGGDAERAVDKDIDVGQEFGMLEAVEGIDDFLRAANGEGGDDEFAFLLGAGVEHGHEEFLLGILEGVVDAVAIGGFHDEVVDLREGFGVFEYVFAVSAYVAGVAQLNDAAAVAYFEVDTAAAQDVAGIVELDSHFALDVEGFVVGDTDETVHTLLCLLLGVDGFDGVFMLLLEFFVEGVDIGLLYAASIGQHDGAEIAGGGGAEDGAAESQLVDVGDETGVVDMGVGEDEVIDFGGVETKVAVHGVGFETFALIHSTVEQDFQALLCGDEVFAASHFASSTHKLQFHIANCINYTLLRPPTTGTTVCTTGH